MPGDRPTQNEVARDTQLSWDGVFVVELASVGEPDQVPDALAAALELPESAETPRQRIRRYCTGRLLVLVLNNAEHLVDAVAAFAEDLLSTEEGLHVLTTSREALRIPGEAVWAIPPMSHSDAAELFARRAPGLRPRS